MTNPLGSQELIVIPGPARILVERLKGDEKSSGGIYLPDSERGDGSLGRVIAVCDPYEQEGEDYEPLYPVGTLVILGKHQGTNITIGRKTCVILKETDVLARAVLPDEERGKLKVHD